MVRTKKPKPRQTCLGCHKTFDRLSQHLHWNKECKISHHQTSHKSRNIQTSIQNRNNEISYPNRFAVQEDDNQQGINEGSNFDHANTDDHASIRSTQILRTNDSTTNDHQDDFGQDYDDTSMYGLLNPDPLPGSILPPNQPAASNSNPISTLDDASSQTNSRSYYDFSFISERMQNHQSQAIFSNNQLVSLKLYDMLRRADAPIGLYDDMRNFIFYAFSKLRDDPDQLLNTRKKLVQQMHLQIFSGDTYLKRKRKSKNNSNRTRRSQKKMNEATEKNKYEFNLHHNNIPIVLKDTSQTIEVPCFDLVSQIASLLQDPFLMKPSNTSYHKKTYFNPRENPSAYYDDIESSDWFLEAFDKNIKDPSKELLVPIIFFIDGVPIDKGMRKSLEPVLFTVGLFKRAVRNLSSAWRVLGFIPNVAKGTPYEYKSGKEGSRLKKYHYHQMLQVILKQLIDLQSKGGIKWNLRYPDGSFRTVLLKFVVSFIIGDCLGNDKLCCRFQNYIPTMLMDTGACRDCNITYKHCCNYNFMCNPLSRGFLKSVPSDILKQLGFYDIGINCFDGVSFGGDIEGINGSTPPEILHQWFLGVVTFIVTYFLERMTSKTLAYLNNVIKQIAIKHSRQSDRSMFTISPFQIGIDKLKLTGKEKGSQLFMIYLALLLPQVKNKIVSLETSSPNKFKVKKHTNEDGRIVRTKMKLPKIMDSNSKYNRWVAVFEDMLSIGEWMSSSSTTITKESLEETEEVTLYTLDAYDDWVQSIYNNNEDNHTASSSASISRIDEDEIIDEIDEDGIVDTDNLHFLGNNTQEVLEEFVSLPETSQQNNLSEDLENDYDSENEDELEEMISVLNIPIVKKKFKISKAEYGIRLFMKNVKRVIHKDDHHKLKSVKFHQLLHLVHYIKKYASPSNLDGGIPERVMKDKAKHPGKHTQQRNQTMNSQTSSRVAEDQVVGQGITIALETDQYSYKKGWASFFTREAIKDSYEALESEMNDHLSDVENEIIKGSGRVVFEYKFDSNNIRRRTVEGVEVEKIHIECNPKYRASCVTWNAQYFQMQIIVQSIYDRLQLDTKDHPLGIIKLFNYIKIDNSIYHASYTNGGKESWFDWCNVSWDVGGTFPAKLIALLDGKQILNSLNIADEDYDVPKGDVWAVVHSTLEIRGNNTFTSQLGSLWKMETQPVYRLISVDDISGPCFVIGNKDYVTEQQQMSSSVLVIQPREQWHKVLTEKYNKQIV